MKFNYTKRFGTLELDAFFDTEIVWGGVYVPQSEGQEEMLILHTTLAPIEKYEKFPMTNKKGEITGYSDRKVTETPSITLYKKEDIEAWLNFDQ